MLVYIFLWSCAVIATFCLFELLVWLPMCGIRNFWVCEQRLKIINEAYKKDISIIESKAIVDNYWTYNQMISAFHIKDVELMKGKFVKPWYLIGNKGLMGLSLKEDD